MLKSNPENIVPFKSYIKKLGFKHWIGRRNLYKSSNDISLDRNIEKNHQERATVFGGHILYPQPREQDDNDLIYPDEFPTRLNPASGSSLIDVAYVDEDHPRRGGIRFLVYMDDETLLQSEISECLSGK